MSEPFFEALRQGDMRAVERAVKLDPGLLRARDGRGLGPLLAALYAGQPELAEWLAGRYSAIGERADLFEAAALGRPDDVRRQLDAASDAVSWTSSDGYTALHLAAYFGRLDVARLLLERGADVNAVASNEMRVTPLHSAVAGRHRDLASLLLALGASANVVQRDGWTPLHGAAQHGDEALVDLLLLRGADPALAADDGRTPADLAVESGNVALAEVLRAAAAS